MRPFFWHEIMEALENELVGHRIDEASRADDVQDSPPEAMEPAVAAEVQAADLIAKPDPVPEHTGHSSGLIDDPKKLILFSEIMKPKFRE